MVRSMSPKQALAVPMVPSTATRFPHPLDHTTEVPRPESPRLRPLDRSPPLSMDCPPASAVCRQETRREHQTLPLSATLYSHSSLVVDARMATLALRTERSRWMF